MYLKNKWNFLRYRHSEFQWNIRSGKISRNFYISAEGIINPSSTSSHPSDTHIRTDFCA